MAKQLSLTIAIPAYNEQGSIEHVVKAALVTAKTVSNDYEILIVNDGSTDATGRIVSELAKKNSHIKIFRHAKNQGFSGAITSCYRHAAGDLLFLLPADGQVDVRDIKRFMTKIPGADVVVGYRIRNPEPFSRKFNSWAFHTLYRVLFGIPLKEISTSILWRTSVLKNIRISSVARSALVTPEVIFKAWKLGVRFDQVPIPYYERKAGKPKGNNPIMILFTIREMFRLWWSERSPRIYTE